MFLQGLSAGANTQNFETGRRDGNFIPSTIRGVRPAQGNHDWKTFLIVYMLKLMLYVHEAPQLLVVSSFLRFGRQWHLMPVRHRHQGMVPWSFNKDVLSGGTVKKWTFPAFLTLLCVCTFKILRCGLFFVAKSKQKMLLIVGRNFCHTSKIVACAPLKFQR